MFAYCNNSPVVFRDSEGNTPETIWDIISLAASVVDVIANPYDPLAWLSLIGDAVDLIPFVTGVGELTRATTTMLDVVDKVHDTAKLIDNSGDVIDTAGDVARRTDFFVTPNGEAIPSSLDAFNYNLSKLDYKNGKYWGSDSNGPIRIRANEQHKPNPNFTGIPDPFHTEPHFHIDRRVNGKTGPWEKTYTGHMEMFY